MGRAFVNHGFGLALLEKVYAGVLGGARVQGLGFDILCQGLGLARGIFYKT